MRRGGGEEREPARLSNRGKALRADTPRDHQTDAQTHSRVQNGRRHRERESEGPLRCNWPAFGLKRTRYFFELLYLNTLSVTKGNATLSMWPQSSYFLLTNNLLFLTQSLLVLRP